MANSLQEQFLKAGLVSKDRIDKLKKDKYKKAKQQQHQNKKDTAADVEQKRLQQIEREKRERDKDLNRRKLESENKKAIAAQIKQLVESSRVMREEGDVAFHFQVKNKIKRIYLTKELHEQVVSGKLALVRLANRYELVPSDIGEKIAQRDPSYVISTQTVKIEGEQDDPYADYQVPDDLMW